MFKYQEEILASEVNEIVANYGFRRDNLLRILQELNDKYNYLT